MADLLIAFLILRGSANDWYFVPLLMVLGLVITSVRYLSLIPQWLRGIRGRDWATVPAVIDLTTVTTQTQQGRGGEYIVGYLATLTYFYRNPDLQTGDYSKLFGSQYQQDAQAWADSYKGSTVMVHVDPRDPSRSVLRKEDL